jgi:hypothetical protein
MQGKKTRTREKAGQRLDTIKPDKRHPTQNEEFRPVFFLPCRVLSCLVFLPCRFLVFLPCRFLVFTPSRFLVVCRPVPAVRGYGPRYLRSFFPFSVGTCVRLFPRYLRSVFPFSVGTCVRFFGSALVEEIIGYSNLGVEKFYCEWKLLAIYKSYKDPNIFILIFNYRTKK